MKYIRILLISFLLLGCINTMPLKQKVLTVELENKCASIIKTNKTKYSVYASSIKHVCLSIDKPIAKLLTNNDFNTIQNNLFDKLTDSPIVKSGVFYIEAKKVFLILGEDYKTPKKGIKILVADVTDKHLKNKMITSFLKLLKNYR